MARGTHEPDGPLGRAAQRRLYLAYERHYGDPRFEGLDEWDLDELTVRRSLEDAMVAAIERELGPTHDDGRPLSAQLRDLIAADDGPSLSRAAHGASLAELTEIVKQRSLYHRKEADPHTFAIPRLRGRAKQLLVEIQAGEYGADGPGRRTHAELYGMAMETLGLDATVNAYIEEAAAASFALSNLVSLFGLNRRWRGAAVGHLAAFECTSVEPMGRYVEAFEAAGAPPEVVRFYKVHVLADAHHEEVALQMVDALADDEPALRSQVLFGVRAALWMEGCFASGVFDRWEATRTRAQRQSMAA